MGNLGLSPTTEADQSMMVLNKLLRKAGLPEVPAGGDVPVTSIETDSRRVEHGSLFVAYKGIEADHHDFLEQAVAAGAIALVAERPPAAPAAVPLVLVPDGRHAWAMLISAWHDYPSRRLRLAGVTGTDGKTTTTSLLHHILVSSGLNTGVISTLEARIGERRLDTGLHTTTPPPNQVQELLSEMVCAGCRTAVLETTSEGLAQRRLDGCDFDLAILTNVTHDHLYYHGNFEAYREAKALLFRNLATSCRKPGIAKVSILNRDDPSYDYFSAIPADLHLTYGTGDADIRIQSVAESLGGGISFELTTPWGRARPHLLLTGVFNALNAAAAITAACTWGVPLEEAATACSTFTGVQGRMEFIRQGQPFDVVVDFAHTPNALENALKAARVFTTGRLIVVFGCAGERDSLKRQPMGEIAVRLADLAVFTAEDPRRESLDEIIATMEVGAMRVGGVLGRDYIIVPDRREAIHKAVSLAGPGDTVILCGKGHEQSMCYGSEERPWSEHRAAKEAIAALGFDTNR